MIQRSIRLTVNGKQRDLPVGSTIASMLEVMQIDRRMVAVARNGDIVPRATFDDAVLQESDRIEVVRMVGGG